MQAIITKYLPATNTRGSRIKASCERGSITIDYPHELSGDAVHIAAADALVAKFVKEDKGKYGTERNPWESPRVCGEMPDGCAHVFSGLAGNPLIVRFADNDDQAAFCKYHRKAVETDGTVGGLNAGLLCSALKRAQI